MSELWNADIMIIGRFYFFLSALMLSSNTVASTYAPGFVCMGSVASVSDGDTLTFRCNRSNDTFKVRLFGVDTPETQKTHKVCFGQPYADHSTDALSRITSGQNLLVEVVAIDRYGRMIANVFSENTNINLELVALGAAHHYKRYSNDIRFSSSEKSAMGKRIGLWEADEKCIIKPWDWRKLNEVERCKQLEEFKELNCF